MKDLEKTKFCLGLQLEYIRDGILVHQMAYTEKVLKRFNMTESHPLSSPMAVRSLGLDTDPFRLKMDDEDVPLQENVGVTTMIYDYKCVVVHYLRLYD